MAGEAFRLRGVVEADTQPADKSLSALGDRVQTFGDTFKSGLGIGAGIEVVSKGLQLLGGAFGALKGSVIDFNQQLDMSRNIFTRYFEGNSQLADAFLNKLKAFAAETPFEFKDLSSLAVRLQAVGVSANDIIPTIKAIGNAASASGSLSQESIGRIGLAIQQMIGKGKVSAEEMNQLIEGGVVDAWKILAKEVGVTEAQVRKMSEAGEISGQTMVNALRKSYEEAGLMEQASKSLTGALSTISDVSTQAFAEMGRGIFELATEGANAFAKFLSTDDFQTWVQVGKAAIDGIVGGIRGLIAYFEPLGEAIGKAFHLFTEGNFSAAFDTLAGGAQTVLSNLFDQFTSFASSMVGAGENLIGSYASGIISGASSFLNNAIQTVADIIASFLIGNSPPPEGPLASIMEGGANTIKAWGEGASSAADAAVKPAASKIKDGLGELKEAGRDVDSAIRDIGKSISDLDSQTRDLKNTIDDVKDGYKDQLDPLEDQLKAITQRTDYEAEEQRLMYELEESALKRAENEAQGSKEIRARIDAQIDELEVQKKAISQTAKLEELTRKANGERSAAEERLESLRDSKGGRSENPRIRELEERLEGMRGRSGGSASDALGEDREKLRVEEARLTLSEKRTKLTERQAKGEDVSNDLKQLAIDEKKLELSIKEFAAKKKDDEDAKKRAKEIADIEKQIKAEKKKDQDAEAARTKEIATLEKQVRSEKAEAQKAEAARQIALANIDREILTLNQQKADLVDKPKLAAIKDAQAELKERREIFETAQKEDKLRRDMQALPIRQEIERIKEEQTATLKPLQEQLETLGRQKSSLQEQKQDYQAIKSEISAASSELRDMETAQKAAAKAAKDAAKEAALNKPAAAVDKTFTVDAAAEAAINKAKEAGSKLATGLRDGFMSWLTDNPIISGATVLGILFGAGQGAAIGASLGSVVPVIGTVIGGVLGAGIGAAIGGLGAGTIAKQLSDKLGEAFGGSAPQMIAQFSAGLQQAWNAGGTFGALTFITDRMGAAISQFVPMLATKLGEWATALVGWASRAAPPFLDSLSVIVTGVTDWIGANTGPIADKLYEWALAFLDWAQTTGVDLLGSLADLGGQVLSWIGEAVTDITGGLVEWATAFVEWVGPKIPELLTELGKLIVGVVEWIGTNTGKILDGLGEWALGFVEWVGPKIPPLLEELGKLLVSLTDWVVHTALPAIAEKLLEWGKAIVDWVGPRIMPLMDELGKLLASINAWFINDAAPAIIAQLAKWGLEFVQWVVPVLRDLPSELAKIGAAVTTYIFDAVGGTAGAEGISNKLKLWVDAFSNWPRDAGMAIGAKLAEHFMPKLTGWVSEKYEEVVTSAAQLGAGMLAGIQRGLTDNWGSLKEWINEHIGKQLPEWMQNLLGIHSPSTVFAEIGENLISGLIVGMNSKRGDLLESAQRLMSFGDGMRLPTGEIAEYIAQAAKARGINPIAALRVAQHEGLSDPDNPMAVGKFSTGWSFWPFQLHYGGAGTPYAMWGNTAGMGNDFTRKTGFQPGDPNAWRASVDFALDYAARNGWGAWYGRGPAGVGEYEGIPGFANGGIVMPQMGGVLARLAEAGRPEAVIPLPPNWQTQGSAPAMGMPQQVRIILEWPNGRQAGDIVIGGYEDAYERGWRPGALTGRR